jgi:hypothetical protein
MIKFEPQVDTVLVKLAVGDIPAPEKQHDTYTSGKIVAVNKLEFEEWQSRIGQTAHWIGYKDDCRLPNKMAFIQMKDILGFSYEDDTPEH